MLNLIKTEWRLLLFGFLMTFWSSPGQTYFISLFSGEIRAELDLSDGQFSAIYSSATLLSAVVMVWSGALVDKIDLGRFSLITIFGLAAGCLLMSVSYGVATLVIAIFVLRHLGQGLMCLTSSTAVVRYIDLHRGKATALSGMGYAVSEALMPSVVVAFLLWFGWRTSWQVFALLVIVLMVIAILYLLQGHRQRHKEYLKKFTEADSSADYSQLKKQWTRSEVIRDKRFYLFVPGLMSQQLMFTGFIFHQIHLVETKGWSLTTWASLFALYAVVSVVTKFVAGYLVDRFGAITMVPWISVPMAIGLVILATTTSIFWGGVFLVLTGITVGYQSTVAAPFWSEMYGNRYLGSIKSLAASIMVFLTAVSPVVIGVFIDFGVKIETLAMAGAIYIMLTCALAYYAYLLTVTNEKKPI